MESVGEVVAGARRAWLVTSQDAPDAVAFRSGRSARTALPREVADAPARARPQARWA
ncbi:hypothetical protein J2S43_001607 [Catenuloplanes nepalensis]|uniref:Uncharacterized protein n=1 Tax=Catenuloplanes nepalensis TaxID=587533 RepID=A0ABT9MNU8_9ACTN|nr:hypothetical protein [Catenuloplanes nepalensis]MDP9793095.1 hypothetical protein [Catenuloplanes nepalensis]